MGTSPLWLRWFPVLAWIAFIIGMLRPGTPVFKWVGKQPWGDKVTHVLVIGMLAFLFDHALANRSIRLWFCRVPLAILMVALFMTGEELTQMWIPGRNFDWGDLTANYLGIGAAWLASVCLLRRRAAQVPTKCVDEGTASSLP